MEEVEQLRAAVLERQRKVEQDALGFVICPASLPPISCLFHINTLHWALVHFPLSLSCLILWEVYFVLLKLIHTAKD